MSADLSGGDLRGLLDVNRDDTGKAKFHMSELYLRHLNELMRLSFLHAYNNDLVNWYLVLYSVYRRVYPYANSKEASVLVKDNKRCSDLVNAYQARLGGKGRNKGFSGVSSLYACLSTFEINLNIVMKKNGLLVPEHGTSSDAFEE